MEKRFLNYLVSDDGKIFSIKANRYLKLGLDTKGYKVLKRGKNAKDLRVHRIVAELFIPNPNNLPEVNHKNGIKTDNRICNLEWVSHQANCLHAWRTGLRTPSEIQRQKARESAKQRLSKRCRNKESGIIYYSTKEASRQTGIANSTICYNINHSKNPKWEYL